MPMLEKVFRCRKRITAGDNHYPQCFTVFQAEKYSGLKHGLTLKSFGTDAERTSEGPLQLPQVCK
jgi:hypothetical protein